MENKNFAQVLGTFVGTMIRIFWACWGILFLIINYPYKTFNITLVFALAGVVNMVNSFIIQKKSTKNNDNK